jgi:hypothetical protein
VDADIKVDWDARIPLFMEGFGPNYTGDRRSLSLTSDSEGRFNFRAVSLVVFVSITKSGYYQTRATFHPGTETQNPASPIPLLRIINPQAMIGKKVRIRLPPGTGILHYDLLKGDCLPPLGKGSVPDLEIAWTRPVDRDAEACRLAFKSRFVGEGNGIIIHQPSVDPSFARSRLRSNQEAPGAGYQSQCDFGNHFRGGGIVAYMKIRRGGENGPLFGKMLDPISYWAANDGDEFKFEYVVNPSGNPGLEMDMKRITVPSRHQLEQPPVEF